MHCRLPMAMLHLGICKCLNVLGIPAIPFSSKVWAHRSRYDHQYVVMLRGEEWQGAPLSPSF